MDLNPFAGLLLRHRGRTGLIQRELAARAGVSLHSLQDWEAGVTLPTVVRLRALIRAFLDAGGLTKGREIAEARELWIAVQREARRMRTPFDAEWLATLLAAHSYPPPTSVPASDRAFTTAGGAPRIQDWGDAPDTAGFVGSNEELALLREWVEQEHCPLVAVLGLGRYRQDDIGRQAGPIGDAEFSSCVVRRQNLARA